MERACDSDGCKIASSCVPDIVEHPISKTHIDVILFVINIATSANMKTLNAFLICYVITKYGKQLESLWKR